jgi:hypothetical protein
MLTADAVEPYVKGLQVWIPDPKEGWRLATVESRTLDDKELVLELRLENSAEDEVGEMVAMHTALITGS